MILFRKGTLVRIFVVCIFVDITSIFYENTKEYLGQGSSSQKCSSISEPTLRSLYFDPREDNSLVLLGEIPKRSEITSLKVTDRNGAIIFRGRPTVKLAYMENPGQFVPRNYPFFTHQHARIISFLDSKIKLELPASVDLELKIAQRKCLSKNHRIYRGGTIPKYRNLSNRNTDIEVCTAIIRVDTDRVSPENNVTSEWIHHTRSFASKINFYTDNQLNISGTNKALLEASKQGFLELRIWEQKYSVDVDHIKHKLYGQRFGDYRTYGWSQTTALLDCIHDAASRNVFHVLVIDPDEFYIPLKNFTDRVIEFRQVDHYLNCITNLTESTFHKRFYADFHMTLNIKSMFDPWYVKDLDCHRTFTLVGKYTRRLLVPVSDGYIAHIKRFPLRHRKLGCVSKRSQKT